MKFATKSRPAPVLPGVIGTVRVDRRTRALLSRLREGDLALIDHVDLDRGTAQTLVDSGVTAVLNATAMISGRYPNLGPQVLADAGVQMIDQLGSEAFSLIRDGAAVRVLDGQVHLADDVVVSGRELGAEQIAEQLEDARAGLGHQLASFTHNSSEFLRREQDLLLHGEGVPRPATVLADRPVVVVVPGHEHAAELKSVRAFIAEQRPVLIGVDRGADALAEAGFTADVVVLSASSSEDEIPSPAVLRAAKDVIVRVDRGAPRVVTERFERLGIQPLRLETSATTEDAALIVADAGHASVIIGVGMHATLAEFLDRQRAGLASTYLTRLKVGPRLVDATAVPTLYSGRVRPRHLAVVLVAGLLALVAAIGTTPVGQEWSDSLLHGSGDLIDYLQGKLS
ncbi:putative cytokinetic ring protein SteA [Nocardioides houyundeii]|uniref:putative cytokinetic ring protein SteA n=1 Tax=Nocardioides houyundeii TaxID=2045452 RepID=UPI000C794EFC|nr:putative cytokinetic ring protein SteA [Nocardioides houyundeii]